MFSRDFAGGFNGFEDFFDVFWRCFLKMFLETKQFQRIHISFVRERTVCLLQRHKPHKGRVNPQLGRSVRAFCGPNDL